MNRLGIYVDDVYRVDDDGRISADRAFLLFACEVGSRFDRLTVFGRAVQSRTPADYRLPPEVELVGLPHYHDLKAVRAVARASGGTARAMWRGLYQTDTVWVFGPHPFGYLLLVLALLRRKRVVLGVRQETIAYARNRMPGVPSWSPRLLGVRALDAVHRLLARRLPATLVGPAIVEQYGGERPGVLDMTVSLVPAAVIAANGREPHADRIALLTVGRLEVEKNPLLVVEMLAALERRHPGRYRLTWIGRGVMQAEVLARARALGVDGVLELRGYVPFGEELLELYRRSDAFVHVSWTEGVPQVLIEAMACATPVVATAVGGVPRVLDGGSAGLLVPPGDLDALVAAVERVVGDTRLRRELADRGLTVARTLTLEAQSERTAQFIRARA